MCFAGLGFGAQGVNDLGCRLFYFLNFALPEMGNNFGRGGAATE